MIHLNLRADLETALRKMSADSGYAITTICAALMSLGMDAKPSAIEQRCAANARPMGRPITGVPRLERGTSDGAKTKPQNLKERHGWDVK